MNNTNRLLTSDNKGVAQQWVEKRWAPQQQDLEPDFTAAFAQSNSEWCGAVSQLAGGVSWVLGG
jgi:hypothetical protein